MNCVFIISRTVLLALSVISFKTTKRIKWINLTKSWLIWWISIQCPSGWGITWKKIKSEMKWSVLFDCPSKTLKTCMNARWRWEMEGLSINSPIDCNCWAVTTGYPSWLILDGSLFNAELNGNLIDKTKNKNKRNEKRIGGPYQKTHKIFHGREIDRSRGLFNSLKVRFGIWFLKSPNFFKIIKSINL